MTERYPLNWPAGWPRTKSIKRQQAKFEVSFAKARDELIAELQRLEASGIVISSNIPVKKDGYPYATYKEPTDPGVAVYFELGFGRNRKSHVLACDRWWLVRDNLRAIGLHIAAMRGIERWGVGNLEQAFTGYQALPAAPAPPAWWQILGVPPDAPLEEVRVAYKKLALQYHPDAGGSSDRMAELNRAYEEAQQFWRR